MKDIRGKKLAGRPPRHGRNSLSLTLRELGTNEYKDEDALSTLEIAAEINAEKVARAAEEAATPAGSPQVERSPEAESPAAGWGQGWGVSG
jgi:hypothetical protein